MKKILKEFKEFISKGNVLDLAVGVIIGGAFSKIVSSLVNDILMPLLGLLIGGLDLTNLTVKFKDVTISYGLFLQNIVDFILMALCIFIFIKVINKIKDGFNKKEEEVLEEKEVEEVKSNEEKLLEEIRDLLKKNK